MDAVALLEVVSRLQAAVLTLEAEVLRLRGELAKKENANAVENREKG